MKNLLVFFSITLFASKFFAQTLIINEVSNGPSGSQEYVELVVTDTAVNYNCNSTTPPCLDIRGWIFDDNSGYHGSSGIAAGAVRFSYNSMWSCVPVGTIILIYNNDDPNPSLPANDLSIADGNYKIVAPIGNTTLFEKNSSTPGAVACSYPATGWSAGGLWTNTLLANPGDCARIVNLAGCEVFSVCWGSANLNTTIYFNSGGSGSQNVWSFRDGDPEVQSNWFEGQATSGGNQTPGIANDALNAAYINQFNNGGLPINPINVSATSVNSGCTCTGSASATASGSMGGYIYAWYNSSFNPIGQTSATATALCAGTYHVIATSGIGCSDTATVIITASGSTSVSVNQPVICSGSSTTLTATPSIPGGTYLWSPGGQTTQSISVNPLSNTSYTITYTTGGCSTSATSNVTVNPLPTVNAGLDQILCLGNSITLNGTGASTYTWNNGVSNGVSFIPAIGTTVYTVTGTASGCSASDQVSVTVNPLPAPTIIGTPQYCTGSSATLTTNNSFASYTWSNGQSGSIINATAADNPLTVSVSNSFGCTATSPVINLVENSIVISNSTVKICQGQSILIHGVSQSVSGLYSQTFNTSSGCDSVSNVTLVVNPLPNVYAGSDQTICSGSTITLNGSGAETYSWNNGVSNGISFIPETGTHTYTLTGTDVNFCSNTDDITITVNSSPVINAGADRSLCTGETVILSGTIIGTSTYSWSNGILQGVPFSPLEGTTAYTLTGTSSEGCISSDIVNVTVNPIPVIDAGDNVEVCEGGSVTLTATGGNSYTWDNGILNGVSFNPSSGETVYTVSGTTLEGCVNTDQVTVTTGISPEISFLPDVTNGCAPLTVNFTNTSANSDNCIWYMGNGTEYTGCETIQVTFSEAGCYDISLSSSLSNGCPGSLTIENLICVEAAPVADFNQSTHEISEFDPIVIFENTSSGATNFLWNFGDGDSLSTENDPTHNYSNNQYGGFTVSLIATSDFGCTDTAYSYVHLQEELIYYIPNTFTPDGDMYNQTFKPVFTSGFDPYDYSLLIFNRWGELIFESHNSEIGWDGSYGTVKEIAFAQAGVYTWRVEFKTIRNDERIIEVGSVNLLR